MYNQDLHYLVDSADGLNSSGYSLVHRRITELKLILALLDSFEVSLCLASTFAAISKPLVNSFVTAK